MPTELSGFGLEEQHCGLRRLLGIAPSWFDRRRLGEPIDFKPYRPVPGSALGKHPPQRRHFGVQVVVHQQVLLAWRQPRQPPDVLNQRAPPRERRRQYQGVEQRIVKSFANITTRRHQHAPHWPVG